MGTLPVTVTAVTTGVWAGGVELGAVIDLPLHAQESVAVAIKTQDISRMIRLDTTSVLQKDFSKHSSA